MFAITGQRSSTLDAFQTTKSETIAFPPALVHAQLAMTTFAIEPGGGTETILYFSGFSHRPSVDGADLDVPLPAHELSVIGVIERATSVTWSAYAKGWVRGRCDVFWWGEVAERKPPAVSPVLLDPGRAVVLYDAQSGEIKHVHEEIVLTGSTASDNAALARKALALARAAPGRKIGSVRSLHVGGRDVRRRHLHVDVTTHKLVSRPRAQL